MHTGNTNNLRVGTDNGKHTPTYLYKYIYLSGSRQPFRKRLLSWPDIRRSSLVKPYHENIMPPLLSHAVDPSDRRSTFTTSSKQSSRRDRTPWSRSVLAPGDFLVGHTVDEWVTCTYTVFAMCGIYAGLSHAYTSHRTASCTSAHYASTTRLKLPACILFGTGEVNVCNVGICVWYIIR